jgi:ribonuclease HI
MSDPSLAPVVLYFDAAVEPVNPGGWMSMAWVALAADGSEVAHDATCVSPDPANTSNVAEYQALIAGLTWLRECGYTGIHVRGDSQLVIYQLTGRYRVNSLALRPLHAEAAALARELGVQLAWVRRELNHRADAYSVAALPSHVQRRTR